jgi:hypothetical protein
MKNRMDTAPFFLDFKEECLKWIEYFGLHDWEIVFTNTHNGDNRASIAWNTDSCIIRINLNLDWGETGFVLDEPQVRSSAFHEVCHVLLCRMFDLATYRSATEEQIRAENHRVIEILTNTVYKRAKNG